MGREIPYSPDAAAAHKASHQDGGTDEISVVGLSGELDDNQPPKAHALGSASHSAATLAELNAKVSDGSLDKTTDTRTPAAHKDSHKSGGADEIDITGLDPKAHKASHQDGGTDEIDCSGLVGAGGGYVNRGDPADHDFTVGNFTTDATWNELDCSSIVPAGARAIQFTVRLYDDAAESVLYFRPGGASEGKNSARMHIQLVNVPMYYTFIIGCSVDRKIEYYGSNLTFSGIDVTIMGWFFPGSACTTPGALLVDGTAGRVLRQSVLLIQNGTNDQTVKFTLTSSFNGDTIAVTDNCAKGATTGHFTLSADGKLLHIENAGLSGNVLMVQGAILISYSDLIFTARARVDANDIYIILPQRPGGTHYDITTVVDTGETHLGILYITDA